MIGGLVEIEWEDAASEDRWQDRDEAIDGLAKPWLVRSVGHLIHDTQDGVILAGSIDPEGSVCMTLKIPRGMIRKIAELEPKP